MSRPAAAANSAKTGGSEHSCASAAGSGSGAVTG